MLIQLRTQSLRQNALPLWYHKRIRKVVSRYGRVIVRKANPLLLASIVRQIVMCRQL